MEKRRQKPNENKEFDERVLHIRRVSKKTTGGNYVTFSALVAVGDGKGKVGIGLGRGREVPPAINKGITQAKRKMVFLPIFNNTLPHEIRLKYKSSRLLLKPAPPGTGLKLGGVVRAVLDIAGIQNASGKIIGSRNQITNAYAVIEAIKKMKPRMVKGKPMTKVNTEEAAAAKKNDNKPDLKAKQQKEAVVIEKEMKNEKEVKKPKVKTAAKPVKKITKKKTVKAKKA